MFNLKTKKKVTVLTVLTFVFMIAMAIVAFAEGEDAAESVSRFEGTFWSLLPPIIAIALALITKEVYSSLFVGILFGGLLSVNFAPVAAMDNILNEGLMAAVSGTAGIFVFLE